eukprot:gene16749-18443_t
MNTPSNYETAKDLFSYLDQESKGYITLDEVSLLEEFNQSQVRSVFSLLDKNGQGRVTFEDFAEAFLSSGEVSSHTTGINTEEKNNAVSSPVDCPKRKPGTKDKDAPPHPIDIVRSAAIQVNNVDRLVDTTDYKQCVFDATPSSNITKEDDVFEGDGLLAIDSSALSVSPCRTSAKASLIRSPSLRKRQGSRVRGTSCIGSEDQVRLPPDGVEGDNVNYSSPKNLASHSKLDRHDVNRDCDLSKGFAKEAISDLLKIVDSHTLSNLGVYGNRKCDVWPRDVRWNVANEFTSTELSDERKCPPWFRTSMDLSDDHSTVKPNGRRSASPTNNDTSEAHHEATSNPITDGFESISSDDDLYSKTTHNNDVTSRSDDEAELDPMFDYHSECGTRQNCVSADDHNVDAMDNATDLQSDENSHELNLHSESDDNQMQFGATVDRNVRGNLIFDVANANHAEIYDKILNYSGVGLSSCLSSSETSLHELLLEVEAARNHSGCVEDWDTVMKRINAVSIFGGNQNVRYLWQQISIYNSDLVQPFEDFLKCIVNEIQRAYTKCQELDLALNSKTEQHEREVAEIYEDMEQLLSRDKEQLQKAHNEREEHQRCEFNRKIDTREAELQETLKSKAEVGYCICSYFVSEVSEQYSDATRMRAASVEARLEAILEECHTLKLANEKIGEQLRKSHLIESQQRHENDHLLQESQILSWKLDKANREYNEMHENLVNMSKMAEENKQNYQRCLRKYEDVLEEREYFSNLTQELQDLRNANSILQERNSTMNSSIYWRDEQLSPKSPRPRSSNRSSVVSEASFQEKSQHIVPKLASTPIKVSKPMPLKPVTPIGNEYKVIFIGDAGVGKSSIIRKICKGTFDNERVPTSAPDCQRKIVTVGKQSLTLNLWDTVGQERFNSLPPSYFRKADVVVLVYDLIKNVSFTSIRSWIKTIFEYVDENVLLVLCGNKTDLDHRRQVKEENAIKLAKDNDAIFLETSAKNGDNVVKLCELIAGILFEREDTVIIKEESVKIFDQEYLNISKGKISTCC